MSRDAVLSAVRAGKPPKLPLPPPYSAPERADDPVAEFARILTIVGGHWHVATDLATTLAEITGPLAEHGPVLDCTSAETSEFAKSATPRSAVIVDGRVGVAEMGAVWVGPTLLARAYLPVVCHALVVVITREAIVHSLHEGYARAAQYLEDEPYGMWIAGPSKTADIEKTLVIGAQGTAAHHIVLKTC